ncbi:MAG: hypothetical protein ACOC33_03715 [bacterium]
MSRLEESGEVYRKQQISKNIYDTNDDYNSGHPNAQSDGDAKGKGENNNQVGSSIDIQKRNELKTKNKFNTNNPYNDSNA